MVLLTFYLALYCCLQLGYGYKDPHFMANRTAIVHLFEWKWTNVADECEHYLGPNGFAAIQISPPNEHSVLTEPFRPWYERYQPVSYNLTSRSGNESEFKEMVKRCNAVGVRIYVDTVINHMAGGRGNGSGGNYFNSLKRKYPSVPYDSDSFNDDKCKTPSGLIENYNDATQVRDCCLLGLPDLATGVEYVRERIVNYMNNLIRMGVAGFRIDAAKHMWPMDIEDITKQLIDLRPDIYGMNKKPFVYQEVIDLGFEPIRSSEYVHLGRVTEFKYGMMLSTVLRKNNGQLLAYLRSFGEDWSFLPHGDSLVFIDNHDNQRGHGAGGPVLTFFEPKLYKMATCFMLAWPYGVVQLMSSYNFSRDDASQGPPSKPNGDTLEVQINFDGSCSNGWICEHRWREVENMVKFRNIVQNESIKNWWDNGYHQIAFSRGNKGFIVINNEDSNMSKSLQTGLPPGSYCDIISGKKVERYCTGKIIKVNLDGTAQFSIQTNTTHDATPPIIAIHIESKI